MSSNSPIFPLRRKDWNDIQHSRCGHINVCYRNKQMTLSSVTFLMQLNFFLASQMPLHSELMISENCQVWPQDLVSELKLPVLCCFSSAQPYTDTHLPHPWGPSTVPCHGHSIWLPIKYGYQLSITCKLGGFTIASLFQVTERDMI